MAFRDGRADIELKHGESRTATGLPGGITYTVHEQEADQDGYSTGSTGSRGTIPTGETAYAEFTNARNKEPETPPPGTEPETPPPGKKPGTGSLTVMKSVQGEGYNGETFTFVVKLTDSSINGTYGGMTFVGGEAAFSLGDGGSITADGLPEGVGFAVVEADANQNGYVTYATGDSGVITAGKNSAVGFVNQKKPEESDEPGPGDDNGNLGDRRGNLGDRRGNLGARTGDESHVEAWVVLLLAAIALGAGVILYRKKKK